jgi:hypothetical protein
VSSILISGARTSVICLWEKWSQEGRANRRTWKKTLLGGPLQRQRNRNFWSICAIKVKSQAINPNLHGVDSL